MWLCVNLEKIELLCCQYHSTVCQITKFILALTSVYLKNVYWSMSNIAKQWRCGIVTITLILPYWLALHFCLNIRPIKVTHNYVSTRSEAKRVILVYSLLSCHEKRHAIVCACCTGIVKCNHMYYWPFLYIAKSTENWPWYSLLFFVRILLGFLFGRLIYKKLGQHSLAYPCEQSSVSVAWMFKCPGWLVFLRYNECLIGTVALSTVI